MNLFFKNEFILKKFYNLLILIYFYVILKNVIQIEVSYELIEEIIIEDRNVNI